MVIQDETRIILKATGLKAKKKKKIVVCPVNVEFLKTDVEKVPHNF